MVPAQEAPVSDPRSTPVAVGGVQDPTSKVADRNDGDTLIKQQQGFQVKLAMLNELGAKLVEQYFDKWREFERTKEAKRAESLQEREEKLLLRRKREDDELAQKRKIGDDELAQKRKSKDQKLYSFDQRNAYVIRESMLSEWKVVISEEKELMNSVNELQRECERLERVSDEFQSDKRRLEKEFDEILERAELSESNKRLKMNSEGDSSSNTSITTESSME